MKALVSLLVANAVPGVLSLFIGTTVSQNVKLSTGSLEGNPRNANGILSFKGVPYAQPPVGNLRWHSPQSVAKWEGTLNATAFGSSCYASTAAEEPYFTPPSEDCLFLNIWTGAQKTTEKRPVMLWIPGGGFQFGSAAQTVYDGSNLAEEGVVIVSINYRLGVFGFLALSELDAEGTSSGDFGLQDQQLALAWVKSNIAAFGGDPDNVIIFGQSAGAHSIGLLMSSRLSNGLFNRAILESGAFWDSAAGPIQSFEVARQKGAAFQQKFGMTCVEQLRSVSAVDINNAAPWNPDTDPKIAAFSPSLDNYVLTNSPGKVFATGQQMKVPVLAGWTADEQALFLPYGLSSISATLFQDGLRDYFGNQEPEALALYPDGTSTELVDSSGDLCGDMVIREQTFTAANYQHCTAALPSNSVWAYYFTYTSPYSPAAIHTAELPFVFGNLIPDPIFGPSEGSPTTQDMKFSKTVMGYWTNFAKTGNPNGFGLPAWPAYVGAGSDIMELGTTVAPDNYNLSRFNFIASFRTEGVLPTNWVNVNVSAIGS